MANPHKKLAESLDALRALQDRGIVAIRSSDLTRTHRERLVKNSFLQEVMKGWYMVVLESASAEQNIAPFAMFLGGLVSDSLAGKPAPQVPE